MYSLTKGWVLELAGQGNCVNAVRLSLIRTEIQTLGGEPNCINRMKSKISMQRGSEPADVAESIYGLVSEKSSLKIIRVNDQKLLEIIRTPEIIKTP